MVVLWILSEVIAVRDDIDSFWVVRRKAASLRNIDEITPMKWKKMKQAEVQWFLVITWSHDARLESKDIEFV